MVQRYPLSRKDRKRLIERVKGIVDEITGILSRAKQIEVMRLRLNRLKVRIFLADGSPVLVELGNELIPSLFALRFVRLGKAVYVDEGAVKHIARGADVMVPGIVKIEGDFSVGDLVEVLDPAGRPLAIARALMSKEEIEKSQKGRALKNLHYIGDRIFRLMNQISP